MSNNVVTRFPAYVGTVETSFDDCLDEVLALVNRLICDYGVTCCRLSFSQGQIGLGSDDDRVYMHGYFLTAFLSPALESGFERRTYPAVAQVNMDSVSLALARIAVIRQSGHSRTLECATLDVLTGMVILNFSGPCVRCATVDEFLSRDVEAWLELANADVEAGSLLAS